MPLTQNPVIVHVPATATNNSAYTYSSGVTITSEPSTISASENPITWNFNSLQIFPGPNSITNVKSKLTLSVASVPASSLKFAISAATAGDFPTYEFESSAEPKINEFYSVDTIPARTVNDVADSIAFAMNANFSFRQRFYAVSSSNEVIIQALEYGSKWDIRFNRLTIGSALGVSSNNDSNDNYRGQSFKDYAITGDLYIGSSGDFGSNLNRTNSYRVSIMENAFSADNNYYFDVSGIIKNYISTPTPTLGATSMEKMNDALVNYYIVFFEKYDEFRNNYRRNFLKGHTSVKWGLNSSLDYLDVNDLTGYTFDNSSTYLQSGATLISYLTTSPSTKYVYPDVSNEFLSFLYYNGNGSQLTGLTFYFNVNTNYQDGTSSFNQFQIANRTINSTDGGLYCANVSPGLIFTGNTNGGLIMDNYEVQLYISGISGSYQVGESKNYKFINDCVDNGQEITFLNSLNGWDSLLFNGETETTIERKSTTFRRTIGYTPTSTDKVNITSSIDFNKSYKLYSGSLNKEHIDWITTELSKSSDIRINIDDELIPINIISLDPTPLITNNDLFQLFIEYRYSKDENFITQ